MRRCVKSAEPYMMMIAKRKKRDGSDVTMTEGGGFTIGVQDFPENQGTTPSSSVTTVTHNFCLLPHL